MTTALARNAAAGVRATGSERTLGAWRERLRAAWRNYVAYRISTAELGTLTDRQLADLGIVRGDMHRHVRAAIYGN
jgi:uncharacterized protein YjiS (DUF1127 family)